MKLDVSVRIRHEGAAPRCMFKGSPMEPPEGCGPAKWVVEVPNPDKTIHRVWYCEKCYREVFEEKEL